MLIDKISLYIHALIAKSLGHTKVTQSFLAHEVGIMKLLIGIMALFIGLGFILIPSLSMIFGGDLQSEQFLKLFGGVILFLLGITVLWLEAAIDPSSKRHFILKVSQPIRRFLMRSK
ncbi:MAG: hypothetical protein ACO1QB_09715 [Verrucomicrobiales bacterium]